MGSFTAEITEIQSLETLHLVHLRSQGHILSMISLELDHRVKVGAKVDLFVKSSNIILSRIPQTEITLANQLPVKIEAVNIGEIVTTVRLNFSGVLLEAMVTTHQAKKLDLKIQDAIYACINESDLSLSLVEN